jgi:hypothetical protein
MAKKKSSVPAAPRPDAKWIILTEMQINGRNVVKGTELKISGERGRFNFIKHVTTEAGVQWIDVWGGPKGAACIRSFRPERVKTVHSKNKSEMNLAKEFKEKKKAIKAEKASQESE